MPQITNHIDFQGFPCELESCDAVFTRSSERERHKKRHQPYAKRPFKCSTCDFRANQKSGLKCHENSVHLKRRLPCREPGCDRDFSDPSTLSRHMSRRHKSSSKKPNLPSWINFTSTFAIRTGSEATASVDATVAQSSIQRNDGHITKFGRRSPDVSSANITLHTSPLGRQEGFTCQDPPLTSARFSFAPSPTLSPLLGPPTPYQPDWQFQSSSNFYSSGSGVNLSSCSTAMLPGLSLPETNLNGVLPRCGFQIGVDAYGTLSEPTEQSVDMYFDTLLEMPAEDFLAQSSTEPSFSMAPISSLSGPSLMVPPLMTNYDATCSGSDLLCGASQRWQFDTPPLNFGYGDEEYYSRFDGLSSLNF